MTRQETEGNTIPKKPVPKVDPKAPYEKHNEENEFHDYGIDTHHAKIVREEGDSSYEDNIQDVPPTCNTPQKRKKMAEGAQHQKKDKNVLAKKNKNRNKQLKSNS